MNKGPLERLKLGKHCQMCGATAIALGRKGSLLEAAFDPGGEAKTLCHQCRMGSAELLAERNKKARELVGMVARMKTEEEFGDDLPESEDWIMTLNNLIASARKVLK